MIMNLRSSSPISIGDSWQDSAYTTDKYLHSLNTCLGIAPPKCSVLELRLHKTLAWAMLLFCYKSKVNKTVLLTFFIERFCSIKVNG